MLDLRGEVFFGVEDDLVGACGTGEGGFFFGGDGGEDASAEGLGHLDEEEAGAACSGVDENFVAGLHWIGRVQEVVGGQALKDGRCGLMEADVVWDGNETGGWCYGELRVGPGGRGTTRRGRQL